MPAGRSFGPIGTDFQALPDPNQILGADPSSLQGGYSSTDPLGLQGTQGATPLQQGGAKKVSPVTKRELNIVGGAFDWDPPITDAQEITNPFSPIRRGQHI